MSQGVLNDLQKRLASKDDVRLSVCRGALHTWQDSEPPLNLRYTANGRAMVTGTLKCTSSRESGGQERTSAYYANFTAFGDTAESMLGLNKGDRLMMITERQKRKGKDDTWYDNDIIVYFEKV